ncbi:hypothetical protein D3C73_1159120 [compost metagenome]
MLVSRPPTLEPDAMVPPLCSILATAAPSTFLPAALPLVPLAWAISSLPARRRASLDLPMVLTKLTTAFQAFCTADLMPFQILVSSSLAPSRASMEACSLSPVPP